VKKLLLVTMVTLSVAAFSSRAEAGFIEGNFTFGSNCEVNVSAPGGVGTIDFLSLVAPGPPAVCAVAPDPLPGNATINSSTLTNGGVLIPGLVGTAVLEADLNSAANPTGAIGALSFSKPLSEIFVAAPNLNWTLRNIVRCDNSGLFIGGFAAACPAAFGPASPVVFVPGPGGLAGNGASVSIFLEGIVFDTATNTLISNYTGHIDATFANKSYNDLIAAFGPGGAGYIQTAYSGAKFAVQAPAVPEPATLLTFGLGTTYIAWRQRRKNRNK